MQVFPIWRRLITPEKDHRAVEQHDDRIIEHLASLRDHYVPGLSHSWR